MYVDIDIYIYIHSGCTYIYIYIWIYAPRLSRSHTPPMPNLRTPPSPPPDLTVRGALPKGIRPCPRPWALSIDHCPIPLFPER